MTLSFTGARWQLLDVDEDAVDQARQKGWRSAAARCLALRGFHDDPRWLAPCAEHLHDPFAMSSMDAAVARLRHAAERAEHIRIITDYDVDGTTSSLILQAALRITAPRVKLDYHIPDRFTEGYGFSTHAAHKAVADGVDLIVTADIGVRDHAAVEVARRGGVDVLICDHHLPDGAEVPQGALVLCPPQRSCSYPNPYLAACGVSTKVAQAMLTAHPKRDAILASLLKLAAIGTVADMVPLNTLENRAIVHLGLRSLNQGPHNAGLQALLDICNLEPGEIREEDLSFRLGPRINAAGRIARATWVVDLLTCRDRTTAVALAEQLDAWNQERRAVQRRLVETSLAEEGLDEQSFVVVAGREEDGWHRGVVGIVAARIKEKLHRPVAVVSIQGDRAVGSVRSIPGVHAVQALESAQDLLVKFGGHPAAAGFTVPTEHLDELRSRLSSWMDHHVPSEARTPEREVDASVRVTDLDQELLAQLQRLGPFGMGNPEPRLMVRGAYASEARTIGKDKRHLKWHLGRHGVEAVWWGQAQHGVALTAGPVDLLGHLSENVWRGRRTLQFVVQDARPAA